jgi:hypothetical protein
MVACAMSGPRGQAGEGRLALGRALTSRARGELGGFGARWRAVADRFLMGLGRVVTSWHVTAQRLTARKRA